MLDSTGIRAETAETMVVLLRSVLERLPTADIQTLLKRAEYPMSNPEVFSRAEGISWLVKDVFDRDLKKTWALLSPLEQLAIAEAIYNTEGYVLPEYMKHKYGQDLALNRNDPSSTNKKKAPSIRLFVHKIYDEYQPIPDDLAKRLKTFVKRPKNSKISVLEAPSTHNPNIEGHYGELRVFNAQKSVLYDLRSILWLIQNDTLKIGVTGVPTVGLTQKISHMLLAPDYLVHGSLKFKNIRGFAWMMLLQIAGLVVYRKETVLLTQKGEDILNNPPDFKTIKMIFDAFLAADNFDEASRIDTMANTKKGGYWDKTDFTDPAARRLVVTEVLRGSIEDMGIADISVSGGPWIHLSEFLSYLRLQRPLFKVVHRLGNMTLGRQGISASLIKDLWSVLAGPYIKCFLMEYLANLGMIEINYGIPVFCDNDPASKYSFDFISAYDGLYEFRLTELGAYCLGLTKQEPPIDSRPDKIFHVTPNLEVTAVIDHMIPLDVMFLNLCTDKVNAKTWRFNTQKLLNVVDDKNGFLPQFKAFLYDRALSAIPKG